METIRKGLHPVDCLNIQYLGNLYVFSDVNYPNPKQPNIKPYAKAAHACNIEIEGFMSENRKSHNHK